MNVRKFWKIVEYFSNLKKQIKDKKYNLKPKQIFESTLFLEGSFGVFDFPTGTFKGEWPQMLLSNLEKL